MVHVAVDWLHGPAGMIKQVFAVTIEHRILVVVKSTGDLMPLVVLRIVEDNSGVAVVLVLGVSKPAAVGGPIERKIAEAAVSRPKLSIDLLRVLLLQIVQ